MRTALSHGALAAFLLMGTMGCSLQAQDVEQSIAGPVRELDLEGESFDGRIRARGILGLFRVRGTLSFDDGLLVWSARGSNESAPYEVERHGGLLRFSATVDVEGGSHVDWSGTYDGKTLLEVRAVWTRVDEDDFVHDLFLPDVVTLIFTPD